MEEEVKPTESPAVAPDVLSEALYKAEAEKDFDEEEEAFNLEEDPGWLIAPPPRLAWRYDHPEAGANPLDKAREVVRNMALENALRLTREVREVIREETREKQRSSMIELLGTACGREVLGIE